MALREKAGHSSHIDVDAPKLPLVWQLGDGLLLLMILRPLEFGVLDLVSQLSLSDLHLLRVFRMRLRLRLRLWDIVKSTAGCCCCWGKESVGGGTPGGAFKCEDEF